MTEKFYNELENVAISILCKASKGEDISSNDIVLLRLYNKTSAKITKKPFLDKLMQDMKKITDFIKENINFDYEDDNNENEEIDNDDKL